MPANSIFSVRSYSAFTPPGELPFTLGLLTSSAADALFKVCLGRTNHPEFVIGVLKQLPWPSLNPDDRNALGRLAHEGWRLRRSLDTTSEISHAFIAPALLQVDNLSFAKRVEAWAEHVDAVQVELDRVQSDIDELGFVLYGISEQDRRAIIEGFGASEDNDSADAPGGDGYGDDMEDDSCEVVELDLRRLAAGLVSWAVGVAVGRFDVRFAIGGRPWSAEPNPFDPLPICSPGMLTDGDGLPLAGTPPEYGLDVSPVLVHDPGHQLDISLRLRAVFDAVFGKEADRWWADIGVALDAKGGEVRSWLGKGFFDYHLKTYSNSGRKAPTLWPIGTPSGSYVVWLYAHRVSSDSLFQILNDIVIPKLRIGERELTQLRQDAGTDPTASQRRAIDTQERFVTELHQFREELEAVAPLWAPDLNDGIVIVLAPLWQLFAHHRAWSSELKKHWAKLAKGDYDWAQLAMRLWPERVVPKCAEDRSLAIAHGIEDVFWVKEKASDDKWLPRQIPATPMDQLIAQRHSLATTAALQRMST